MKKTLLVAVLGARLGAQFRDPDLLWQRFEFQDAQGAPVTEPLFRPGEKNILIIHGLNGVPGDMRGLTDFLAAQCANVMLYRYPSGMSPKVSGRVLYLALSEVLNSSIRFDMVGYSEGGLVARVATEPGALNDMKAFGDQVENLVTIGMPHEGARQVLRGRDILVTFGVAEPVQAITDMLIGSEFLRTLNTNPQQGGTRYFTLAGNFFNETDDGVVFVDSALGQNVLRRTAGVATVGLVHTTSLAVGPASGRALPNHADVYNQVKGWIIDGAPPPTACAYLGGNWSYRETATERCVIGGQPQSPEGLSGSGTVLITQAPGTCMFRYDVQDLVSRASRLTRDGVTEGSNVTVTGLAATAVPGSGVTFTENSLRATGKLCGRKVNLTGQARFATTLNGVPVSCVYDSAAEFTRVPGGPAGWLASVSAASFSGPILSPESIAAGFGSLLATGTQAATTVPLPTTLAGTRVRVTDSGGAGRDAPLFFASPGQINYLVPAGTATGPARIEVLRGTQTAAAGTAEIRAVAPSLFSANASGEGVAAAVVERLTASGARSSQLTFRFDSTSRRNVAALIHLGPGSDQVFAVLYGTGIRGVGSPERVTLTIDGERLPVLYAGTQADFAGLDQMNAGPLPRKLIGRGTVPVVLEINGRISNVVTLTFGPMLGLPAFQRGQELIRGSSTAVGDMNGDGRPDIVTNAGTFGELVLIRNNGNGTFQAPQRIETGGSANWVRLADLNRDGLADLVTDGRSGGQTWVQLANGSGGFLPPQRYTVGRSPQDLVLTDLNSDGFVDILTGHTESRDISFLRGNGDGTFQPVQSIPAGGAVILGSIFPADVNNDGILDLILGHQLMPRLFYLLGSRSGTFQAPQPIALRNAGGIFGVAVADFNRDGFPDIVVGQGSADTMIVFGSRTGFQPPARILPNFASSIVVGDLNRDGNLDILTNLGIVLGLGGGEFQTPLPAPGVPIAITDLNGDGRPDLVVAAGSGLVVFLQQ